MLDTLDTETVSVAHKGGIGWFPDTDSNVLCHHSTSSIAPAPLPLRRALSLISIRNGRLHAVGPQEIEEGASLALQLLTLAMDGVVNAGGAF